MKPAGPILYCHCAYARVVPEDVKRDVLEKLVQSGVAFDAVADLCQMSAAQDPGLPGLAACPGLRIVACYPRAVRSLMVAAGAPLPDEGVEILNMRQQKAEEIAGRLLGLPADAALAADAEAQP